MAKQSKSQTGKDKYGIRLGTQSAKINAVIGRKALTAEEVAKKTKLPIKRTKSHLRSMVRKGHFVKTKDQKFKVK
jgi:hypothetical protein